MSLAQQLGECIEALLVHGFELPLYFTCMSVNGMMVYGCYTEGEGEDGLHCDIRASYGSEEGFVIPLNIMFVDQRGKAARVVLRDPTEPENIQVFLN